MGLRARFFGLRTGKSDGSGLAATGVAHQEPGVKKAEISGSGRSLPQVIEDQVGGQLAGKVDFGQSPMGGRLQIARPEAVEEGMGGEEDEPEGGDGHRVVVEVVIGMPLVGEFVEALVFNLPAPVSVLDGDARSGSQCLGKSGCPPPVGDVFLIDPLAGDAFAHLGCFLGADHAQGLLIPVGAEALDVPSLQQFVGEVLNNWGLAGTEPLGIAQQIGIIFLEGGDEIFSTGIEQSESGGPEVERVGAEHIKTAGMLIEHAGEQAQRSGDFIFPREHQLAVHHQAQLSPHQFEGHDAVVILDEFLSADLEAPLKTLVTAAVVATVNLMAVDDGQLQASGRLERLVALEFAVDGEEPGSQILEIEPLSDIGALVGAGKFLPARALPDRALAVGFQFVKTRQPAQEHQIESCRKNRRFDLPLGASIPDQPPLFAQAEDLFSVS